MRPSRSRLGSELESADDPDFHWESDMAKGTKKPAQGNTKGNGSTKPSTTKGCGTNTKGCGK